MIAMAVAGSVIGTLFAAAILNQLVLLVDAIRSTRDVWAGIRSDLFVEVKQVVAEANAAAEAARKRESTRREEIAKAVQIATQHRQAKPH